MAEARIRTGGQEQVQDATDLLSKAFEVDPTITYLLPFLTAEQRDGYRPKLFHALLTAAALKGALFDEAVGWKSCGVLILPDRKMDSLSTPKPAGFISVLCSIGLGGCQGMLQELLLLTKACKAKCLREDEEYYYVFFFGTQESGRGKGLCSAIVRHYQSIAAREQLPIYMEAATEYCWGLYKKLGFVTVDELLLGDGKAAADGPGVKMWGMIWRPERSR